MNISKSKKKPFARLLSLKWNDRYSSASGMTNAINILWKRPLYSDAGRKWSRSIITDKNATAMIVLIGCFILIFAARDAIIGNTK